MSRDTKAMQDDDTTNPGDAVGARRRGAVERPRPAHRGKSCADCHGDAATSMKGVAARYPAFDAGVRPPGQSRAAHQHCRASTISRRQPFAYESKDLLALSAYVAMQSRGEPIAPPDDPRLKPFLESGRDAVQRSASGQLNLSCAQCHDDNWGKSLAGNVDAAGASDRLSDLPAGMAEPRLAAAAAAQLHDRACARSPMPTARRSMSNWSFF